MSEGTINVGRGVRRARKEMAWTQAELAKQLEHLAQAAPDGSPVAGLRGRFTSMRVSAIERTAPVDDVTLSLLAQALHVSVSELTDARTSVQQQGERPAAEAPAAPVEPEESSLPTGEAAPAPIARDQWAAAVERLAENMAEPAEKPAVQRALAAGERSPREVIEESVEVVKRTADKLRAKTGTEDDSAPATFKLREKTAPAADAPFDPPPFAPQGAEPIAAADAAAARRGYMRKIFEEQQPAMRAASRARSVAAPSPDHVLVTVKSQAVTIDVIVPRGAHVIAGGAEAFEQLEVSWS